MHGVLIAVAPIAGTVTDAGNIARALGFAIAAIEAALDADYPARPPEF